MAIDFDKFKAKSPGMKTGGGIDFQKFITVKKEAKPAKDVAVKTVDLPEFLGGGSFKTSGPGSFIPSERDYGGVPTLPGSERHHIVPVALAGVSDQENIRVLPKEDHAKISDVGNKAISDYKAGKISLPEARLVNLTALQRIDDNLDEKSWLQKVADKAGFVDSIVGFWDKISGKDEPDGGYDEYMAKQRAKSPEQIKAESGTLEAGKQPIYQSADFSTDKVRGGQLDLPGPWPLKVINALYNVPSAAIANFATAADKIAEAAIDKDTAEGAVSKKKISQTPAANVSRGTNLVLSSLGLIPSWLAVSTALEAGKEIPIVKYPAEALSFGLEKIAEGGGALAGAGLDAAPISEEAKAELRKPIEEIAGLIAQIFVAHKMVKVSEKVAKSEPVVQVTSALKDTATKVGEALESRVRAKMTEGAVISPKVAQGIAEGVIKDIQGQIDAKFESIPRTVPKPGAKAEGGTVVTEKSSGSLKKPDLLAKGDTITVSHSSGGKTSEITGEVVRYSPATGTKAFDVTKTVNGKEMSVETVNRPAGGKVVIKNADGTVTRIKSENILKIDGAKATAKPPSAPPKQEVQTSIRKLPASEEVPDFKTEFRKRGLSAGVEAKAVEAKLTEGFRDVPKYETVNMKEQAKKASDLLESSPIDAVEIAMGRKPAPEGLLPESVFVAVENFALKTKNVDMLRKLATKSKLAGEATEMGQRIRALGERNPNSAVSAIQRVADARKAKAGEKAPKVVERIKREMKKREPTKESWSDFIESIKC